MTTMTKPVKKVLETAFEKMGMEERLEELWDIIDEIELDSELELSLQEIERGEYEDVFEATADIKREVHERHSNKEM